MTTREEQRAQRRMRDKASHVVRARAMLMRALMLEDDPGDEYLLRAMKELTEWKSTTSQKGA